MMTTGNRAAAGLRSIRLQWAMVIRAAAAVALAVALLVATLSPLVRAQAIPHAEGAMVLAASGGCQVTVQGDSGARYEVRYLGVDCSASGHPFADLATEANRARVLGQRVWLERDGADADASGARLRHLTLAGATIPIAADLLGLGLAWLQPAQPTRFDDLFRQIQAVARAQRGGVWALGGPSVSQKPTGLPAGASPSQAALLGVAVVETSLGRGTGFAAEPYLAGLPDGAPLIVTAAHLIPGEGGIVVRGPDGRQAPAERLRLDRALDLAVLRPICSSESPCPQFLTLSFAPADSILPATALNAVRLARSPETQPSPTLVGGSVASGPTALGTFEVGLVSETVAIDGPLLNLGGEVLGLAIFAPIDPAETGIGTAAPLAISSAAILAALADAAPPPDEQRTMYLLPILDGQPTTADRVRGLLSRLGRGGPYLRVGFSGVFRYLADVDPNRDFQIVTTRLEEIAATARQTRTPFLVHLNGGRWAGGGPLLEQLALDRRALVWNYQDHAWTKLVDGEWFFSLSTYNEPYRSYKERNLRAAAAWLAGFAAGPDGDLLVGVSTDSEVLINVHPGYDYNPAVAREFRDWLAGEGEYRPRGRWAADGQRLTLKELNARLGTNFPDWERVGPPREAGRDPLWTPWLEFRRMLVDHDVQQQVDWIRESGLPADRIFTHQTPELSPDIFGDSLETAQVRGGNVGITLYPPASQDAELLARVQALGRFWGTMEYNANGSDVGSNAAALELLRSFAPRIVCPYHWDQLGGVNEANSTIVDTPFEIALRDLVRRYRVEPLP